MCQDVTVFANENCQALVTVEQVDAGSYDPDGDPVIIEMSPEGYFDLGETEVTLSITDDSGETDQCTATITVTDNESPVLNVVSEPIILWPPNHKYETIDLTQLVLSVSDNCNSLSMGNVFITSVSCDEEENAIGKGDGNTMNDIVLGDDCQSVMVRKERNGKGNGRVYTIYLGVTDESGNTAFAQCQAMVPKNNSNQSAMDDGAIYSHDCNKSSPLSQQLSVDESMLKNFPNPFNEKTTLSFTVTSTGSTNLKVFNATGSQVSILFSGKAEAGQKYLFEFDGRHLPKGIYFCQLQTAQGETITRKMILGN